MIEFIPQTGSTNADLAARVSAAEQVPEGHWLIADRQTAGRGRMGREWQDGAGNFMGSTVVHAAYADPPPATLALVAGIALHEVIAAHLLPTHCALLKWPNDVMIGSAKLAGILLERTGEAVVVGIGVNLASAPALPDRATIALADLTTAPARDMFAESLAAQFAVELGRWRAYGLASVIARWLTLGHPLGTGLRITEPDGSVLEGSFAGLTDLGLLQLRLENGSLAVVNAGDVRLEQE